MHNLYTELGKLNATKMRRISDNSHKNDPYKNKNYQYNNKRNAVYRTSSIITQTDCINVHIYIKLQILKS